VSALRAEAARKALHLLSAAVPLAWAFALVPTAVVRIGLGAALAMAGIVEWLRRLSPAFRARFLERFGPLLRSHEAHHITGATWLAGVMCLAVWVFPRSAAIVALWAAAVGDAMAALVGRLAAARSDSAPITSRAVDLPPTVAIPPARKTLAGSVACMASTAAGAVWLAHAPLPAALGIGAAAAVAEWPRFAMDDNLRVGLAAGAAAWMLLSA
jgi:dolichol kinase